MLLNHQEPLEESAKSQETFLVVKLPLKNLPTPMTTLMLSSETVMLNVLTSYSVLKDGDTVLLTLPTLKESLDQSTLSPLLTEKHSNNSTDTVSMPLSQPQLSMPDKLHLLMLSLKLELLQLTSLVTSLHQELSPRLEMLASDPLKLETEQTLFSSLQTFL